MEFIEVTTKREQAKQLVNVRNIESITKLNEGCVIHYLSKTTVTIIDSYEGLKTLLNR